MKLPGAVTLSFIYASCFLGSGFVSGQELWQFFGSFGVKGYLGFFLSTALFVAFGIMLLRLTQMTGYEELGRILVPWEKAEWLRHLAVGITTLFLFGVMIQLTAGVGALGAQLFSLPSWLGSAIFIALVCVIAMLGVTGMMNAASVIIPILVLATILFAVGAWRNFDVSNVLRITKVNNNPLTPNWLIASLIYVAYNLIGGIGMMVPVGKVFSEKKTVWCGIILCGIELTVVATSILSSIISYPAAESAQMPMVAVGSALSPFLGGCYGVTLLLGMFCNALTCLVGLLSHVSQRFTLVRDHRKAVLLILMVIFWAGSLLGFSNIIRVVLPIFGYLSITFLATMAIHFITCKIECKKKSKV